MGLECEECLDGSQARFCLTRKVVCLWQYEAKSLSHTERFVLQIQGNLLRGQFFLEKLPGNILRRQKPICKPCRQHTRQTKNLFVKTPRQHHPNGNMELLWQIGLNMHLDGSTLNTVDGFKEFLFLTQV